MRCAMTRVLPEPAPARISNGPSLEVTASRCCSLSSERRSIMNVMANTFKHTMCSAQTECQLILLLRFSEEAVRSLRVFVGALRRIHELPFVLAQEGGARTYGGVALRLCPIKLNARGAFVSAQPQGV